MIYLTSGQDLTPDKYHANGHGTPYLTGASNINSGSVIINRWTVEPRAVAIKGDLLITCKGTVGAMAFLQCEKAHIARQIMSIRIGKLLCSEFIHSFLEAYLVTLKAAAKSMIPGISREDLLTIIFPLPPASEQHRIANYINSLLSICHRL